MFPDYLIADVLKNGASVVCEVNNVVSMSMVDPIYDLNKIYFSSDCYASSYVSIFIPKHSPWASSIKLVEQYQVTKLNAHCTIILKIDSITIDILEQTVLQFKSVKQQGRLNILDTDQSLLN